jgi:8-oxo-dGTP pyrophosphatase MutT (NUDIX family)
MLRFEPGREPTPPRDAATVLVVRDGAAGLEIFCVRRSDKSGFLSGALVFPGGKVDAADADAAWAELTSLPDARAELVAGASASALSLAVAACRETLEEARILVAEQEIDPDVVAGALASGFLSAVRASGARLALDRLAPFARWVTPEAEARRFDARFFLVRAPHGQEGRHDDHETTHSLWGRPADVLEAAARGEYFLAPPTARSLELLATAKDVNAALTIARAQSLAPICPVFVQADEPFLALPGDPAHPIAERRVDGPSRYVLRDGRFWSEDPR